MAACDLARRGLHAGFVMANHGKRPPVARMSVGDGIFIYSPTTTYPRGEPLRSITMVGEVTGGERQIRAGGRGRRGDLALVADRGS